ncbi:beta-1,3-galactosyltransferase 1-like isoform X1 [Anguilla rostrata]|uniref:beta-1,3-galactosyltransferase 1-like isoform X1 n=2 Tax=Anguilla rostrata TaxID=7938 RepID=UPI0030CF079A
MDAEDPSSERKNIKSMRLQDRRRMCSRYRCRLFGMTSLVTATLACLYVFDLTLPSLSLAPTKEWWGRVHMNLPASISGTTQKPRPALTNVSDVTNITSTVSVAAVTNISTNAPEPQWEDPGPYCVAYPRRYRFVLDEPDACRAQNPFLVLMVPVAPQEWVARDAIRRTWGKERLVQGKRVLLFFVLGLPGGAEPGGAELGGAGAEPERVQKELRKERAVHRDLLQADFRDSYYNLTIKTIMIQEWVASRCPGAPYGMKIDSDMFLNVDNLVAMLLAFPEPRRNYITGMLTKDGPVVRDPRSKWYLPVEVYPEPTFPSYPLGMGYVFSTDLSRRIVDVSRKMKPVYIEDAHLGMCLKRLGVSPTHPPRLALFKVYQPKPYDRCHYAKAITTILDSPQMLVDYWEDLQKPGPPC